MSNTVLVGVNNFIDFALIVTIILIIYYAYRFATFQSKEEKTEEEESQEKLNTKIKEKTDKAKEDRSKNQMFGWPVSFLGTFEIREIGRRTYDLNLR